MKAAFEFEHDRRTAGQDQRVTHWIMRGPNLHVGTIKRVADVDRVIEQQRGDIGPCHLVAQSLKAIGTSTLQNRIGHRADQGFVRPYGIQIGQLAVVFEDGVQGHRVFHLSAK